MKKYLITILTLLIMLVGQSAGTGAAAGNVTLVGVSWTDQGPIFTFRVSGKFSKSELRGTVHVENGGDFSLHCKQVNEDTVKCHTSRKVSGVNVSVSFGGSTFWTYVTEAPALTPSPSSSPSEYCYSIWDYWWFTNGEWVDFGPHCQGEPANEGDSITYNVPDPISGSYESLPVDFYVDVPDFSNSCSSPVPYNGPAYYYSGCPED
jgi:hypothetical protein